MHAYHRRGGPHNHRSLSSGGGNLDTQPHLAFQQFYVELLHELLFNLTLLGLEAHEAQVELVLLLFRHVN